MIRFLVNGKLFADCRHDENRMVAGRTESVGTLLLTEKEHLLSNRASMYSQLPRYTDDRT
jgi:hypothetical protein